MSHEPLLHLRNLDCGYGGQSIVQSLNLHLNRGDIGCLLGPSGCGKTTTLRAIAGFEHVNEGEIQLGDAVLSRRGFTLAPEKRRVGMVFQDYALFPHLTVTENIGFGIRKHPQSQRIVREMLDLCISRRSANAIRTSFPAASNSVLRSPEPLRPSRNCFY